MSYYVYDDKGCKAEGLTKQQILTAITEAVETHAITDVDTGFVTTLKEANGGRGVSLWVGTTAQYNALANKALNRLYIITDDEGSNDYADFIDRINVTLWTGAAQHVIGSADTYINVPNLGDYSLVGFLVNDSSTLDAAAYYIVCKPVVLRSGVLSYAELKSSWFKTYGIYFTYGEGGGHDNDLHLSFLQQCARGGDITLDGSPAYLLKIVGIM